MKFEVNFSFKKFTYLFFISISFIFLNATEKTKEPKKTVQEEELQKELTKLQQKKTISVDLNKEIVFCQSAFLSEGSLKLYGELIRNAINAKFYKVNSEGGIKGKTLKLISLDDRGEPVLTEKNIKTMLSHKVDIFLGNMGTRSTLKLLSMIESKKIAVLFPWGGSDELRKPNLKYLVNGLGLIEPQISALTNYAIKALRLKKIAIFHEDSSFGKANTQMTIEELKKHEVAPVAIAAYNRFTMDIETPALKLIESDPKIVICLATSTPTVKLINKFYEKGHFGTKFIGIDSTMFVGDVLRRKGASFHYASPMPDPKESILPIVKLYQADMQKFFPNDPLNILSLSYYIHATIIIEALKKIEGPITKEKLLNQIENMKNISLNGFNIDFNPETRHAYKHNISILKG